MTEVDADVLPEIFDTWEQENPETSSPGIDYKPETVVEWDSPPETISATLNALSEGYDPEAADQVPSDVLDNTVTIIGESILEGPTQPEMAAFADPEILSDIPVITSKVAIVGQSDVRHNSNDSAPLGDWPGSNLVNIVGETQLFQFTPSPYLVPITAIYEQARVDLFGQSQFALGNTREALGGWYTDDPSFPVLVADATIQAVSIVGGAGVVAGAGGGEGDSPDLLSVPALDQTLVIIGATIFSEAQVPEGADDPPAGKPTIPIAGLTVTILGSAVMAGPDALPEGPGGGEPELPNIFISNFGGDIIGETEVDNPAVVF
ncbi:MAG: hypothetical protein ACXABY_04430 [Candidatus Thorarchaeota archaeon]|jgi:hypothetical protein